MSGFTVMQRKKFLCFSGLSFILSFLRLCPLFLQRCASAPRTFLTLPRGASPRRCGDGGREDFQSHPQISNRTSLFCFLIFSFAFPSSAEAKIWTMSIKRDLFLTLRDFRAPRAGDDFKFRLDSETNEVDISDFTEIIKRAKKSKYNNFPQIDGKIKKWILNNYLFSLCEDAKKPVECKQKAQTKIQRVITGLGRELSQGIRYPYDYYLMDTSEGREALSEARDLLALKCPDCGKIHLDHGSKKEFDRLVPLIKKQKPSCLKKITENMAKRLKHYRMTESCKKNKTHSVCKSMAENYNSFRDRLLRLTKLVYGQSAHAQTEMRLCVDCVRFSDKEKIDALDSKQLESSWQQSRNCEELQPGGKKRVSSGTGLDKEYLIRREKKDGSYSAVLNLQFVAADDYEGEAPSEQVPSHYRNQVRKCLKKANEKMLGPKGEKLQIVLREEPSEKSPCPEPVETIKIGRPGVFSVSSKYASDVDCPVITHEILHQMGLCDDYLIQTRGYIIDSKTGKPVGAEVKNIYKAGNLAPGQFTVLKYDCRVTRSDSVMAHHYTRWADVFSKKTRKSLLTPEQFSAILYGNCKSRNQLFNECSQLAYVNSFEDETCLKKRQECERRGALGSP